MRHAAIGLQFRNDARVLRGVGQHGNVFPVLGSAAHHGRAANVDVLDRVLQRTAGLGHRGFKRVQIDHQHVDGVDVVFGKGGHVGGHIAACQQPAVHAWVQGFHAAVEHFGKACHLCHFGHGDLMVCQQFGGASRREQLDASACQRLRELEKTGLVRD